MKKFTFFILALFISVGVFSQGKARRNNPNERVKESSVVIPSKNAVDNAFKPSKAGVVLNLNKIQKNDKSTLGNKSTLLLDNGPIVTDAGAGAGGADVSLLQTGNTSLGFAHSISGYFMVAEDFVVNATSWTVDSIAFFAYQTGSTLTSTMTTYQIMIWDGVPGVGNLVWGDTTTNRLSSTSFSNVYRGSTLTGTTRPIMQTYCATPGLVLTGGSYWIGWRAAGSLASGPWAVPITITGQTVTGNAMQLNAGTWANLADGANQQGLPFIVYGTEVAATCPFPADLNAANITTTSADLSWTEAGSATSWDVEYGVAGFTPTGVPTNAGLSTPSLSLTLSIATSYDYYVRADCGGGDYSLWVGPYTFNTLSCEVVDQCDYTLVFNDAFGDGWNGCTVDIVQGGVSTGLYTLASGSTGTQTVGICDAKSIDLIFNVGAYPEECSFSIVNPFGDTLFTFADGSLLTDGAIFYSFTSSCTPPACPKPTTLAVSNITNNSADITWVEAGSATLWDVEFGVAGFTPTGVPTDAGLTTPSITLSLSAATSYDVYVRADCGGAQSIWVGPLTFTTLCDIFVAPYVQDFENAGAIPSCWADATDDDFDWSYTNTTTPSTGTGPSADHTTGTGYYAFVESSSPNNPSLSAALISPSVDISGLTNPALMFWYNMNGAGMGSLSVDVYDGTWHNDVNVISGDHGDVWTKVIVDISMYNSPVQIKFRAITGSDYTSDAAIDDVSIEEGPSCFDPTNLSAQNATMTSVDLSWTSTASIFNVEFGAPGFTQGTGTAINGVSNPYTLNSGLTAGTPYEYYVQADCGSGNLSAWVGPFAFGTASCLVTDQCDYTLDMTDSYGDGWNGASVTVLQNGVEVGTYTVSSVDGTASSAIIGLCDAANIELYWTAGGFPDECSFTLTDPFTNVVITVADGSTLTDATVFHTFTSACTPPACPKVTLVSASSITTSSVVLSWTNGGSETAWNIEYGPSGYTQGTGTTLAASTNPYTLSGLTSATTYDVYVQADCGADQSTWEGPVTFTTLCADVTSFPYTEDFEGMTTDFICWNVFKNTAADGGLDGSNLVTASTANGDDTWFVLDPSGFNGAGASYIHGGTHAAALGYTAPDFNWLISSDIVLPAANFYALKYWTWRKDSVEAAWITKFYVQVFADGIWNNVLSYTDGTNTNELTSEEVVDLTPFAGKTIKVAFVFEYNDGYEMSIDDITIDQTTNANNIENYLPIGIYPNPTKGIVNIRNAENSNVFVYDIIGNTVASFNNISSVGTIDLSNLSEGNYVIKVVSEKETINKQITIVK